MKLYDKDIRDPLYDYLEEQYGKIRVFEEINIGRCRADMLMLTDDCITGIEIKSDADTYERLKRQVRFYNKYCDRNYVAIGVSHAKHVAKHIPDFWGILIVSIDDGHILVTELRPPQLNPKMKPDSQITLLWRPELQRILEKNSLPRYKQRSKKFVQQKLMERLLWETLKPQMCEELFERDYTLWDEELELYKNS